MCQARRQVGGAVWRQWAQILLTMHSEREREAMTYMGSRMCQCRAGAEEYSGLEATEMSLKSAPVLRGDRNHGEEDRMPGHTCPESSRKCRKSISPSRLQKAIAVQKESTEGTDKQDARHYGRCLQPQGTCGKVQRIVVPSTQLKRNCQWIPQLKHGEQVPAWFLCVLYLFR